MSRIPKPSGFHDKNGRPIYEGDLLKTFHFKCANRRLPHQYLYHLVCWDGAGGRCKAIPARSFTIGADGGSFWITKDLDDSEIIDGPSLFDEKRNLVMWCERRKKGSKL